MNNFSIRDLAKFSGLQQHTIRIWEQRFSFLKPGRNKASRREYSPEELGLFMDIMFLRQNGYKVSHIASMTAVEKTDTVRKLSASNLHQKAIHELIICMAEMDPEGFELVLDNCAEQIGMLTTIEKILLPFAEKVEIFEMEECRNYLGNIALIANFLKQRLHAGIELLKPGKKINDAVFIFSLHPQISFLQLDFLHYYLKKEGFQVQYPSPQLTLPQLELIWNIKRPSWIIIDVNGETNDTVLKTLVNKITDTSPESKPVFLSNKSGGSGNSLLRRLKEVIGGLTAENDRSAIVI